MSKYPIISPDTLGVLQRQMNAMRQEIGNLKRRVHAFSSELSDDGGRGYIAKTGASGIDAGSTSAPASADVELYKLNSDGDYEEIGRSVTAYNMASPAVSGNAMIQLKQDTLGHYLVDFEDCG